MFNVPSWIHRAACAVASSLGALLLTTNAPAAAIDVSLNVLYNNPANVSSGGTWHVVAKSDGSGIAGLELLLSNIDSQVTNDAPRGIVNGSDLAGLAILGVGSNPLYKTVVIGQAPIDPSQLGPSEEQVVFYGVGTLANGAPNYPGKPPGTNSIGPTLDTLTSVQGVPWATENTFNDPAWLTAARLVSGTFAPGATPTFFETESVSSSGNVFTSLGDDRNPGPRQTVELNTIVRTNFSPGGGTSLGDYNFNGHVDAADYVIWRKTLNQVGGDLPADGDNDGTVDPGDYEVWRTNFGRTPGAGASLSTNAVPEPAGLAMLAWAGALAVSRRPICRKPAARRGEKLRVES
jgi:hypothetical protein